MKYIYRILSAIFFFDLAVQICFCLPFLKCGLLLAIGSPLFQALLHWHRSFKIYIGFYIQTLGLTRSSKISLWWTWIVIKVSYFVLSTFVSSWVVCSTKTLRRSKNAWLVCVITFLSYFALVRASVESRVQIIWIPSRPTLWESRYRFGACVWAYCMIFVYIWACSWTYRILVCSWARSNRYQHPVKCSWACSWPNCIIFVCLWACLWDTPYRDSHKHADICTKIL